ncbi:MAG: cell division protein FtsA [Candidatus Margulisbacteria bacterium]|nr:cell division protein FtsA [Candidatus Margulisiibacteriota bacterium]
MMNNTSILGLDLGSNNIYASVCNVNSDGDLILKGIGSSLTTGFKKGTITNPEEARKCVSKAVDRACKDAEVRPQCVISNIPCQGIQFVSNSGIVVSKSTSGLISAEEKNECIEKSKRIIKDASQVLLHVNPLYFNVDGKYLQNPVGVKGQQLEVKTHIVLGDVQNITSVRDLLSAEGFQIKGLVFDGIAISHAYLTKEERMSGAAVLDIGGQFTKLTIYKHDVLYYSQIIPIGGDTITRDISQVLNVTFPEAERLKILYGQVNVKDINPKETISITTINRQRKVISKQYLCEIIEARVNELIQFISSFIQDATFSPPFMVLCGKGSQLSGITNAFEKSLPIRLRIGLPTDIDTLLPSKDHALSIGLIYYGLKMGALSMNPPKKWGITSKMKRWFRK